jgi:hypothetical protein
MTGVQLPNATVTITHISDSRVLSVEGVANIQHFKREGQLPSELNQYSGVKLDFTSSQRLLIDAPNSMADMPFILDRVQLISCATFPAFVGTYWRIYETPKFIPGLGAIGPTLLMYIAREKEK